MTAYASCKRHSQKSCTGEHMSVLSPATNLILFFFFFSELVRWSLRSYFVDLSSSSVSISVLVIIARRGNMYRGTGPQLWATNSFSNKTAALALSLPHLRSFTICHR
ncbi:hypothetical protein BJY52DRAFT_657301 [Lactarius psammicola]|nr:hypothetical protein BJY52DRAFT_657301 [Lactarius psammicola]